MSHCQILLITPPFTQPNTPYPATAFLTGYFDHVGIESAQVDLGLEVILQIFSKQGLEQLFAEIAQQQNPLGENEQRMVAMQQSYIATIEPAIAFLQGQSQTLAHLIATGEFLPEASRFDDLEDMEWAFGNMGMHDKARHLITLYLEDITDLIVATIDPEFGFSRYAEQLGRMASSFTPLHERLQRPNTYVDNIMLPLLHQQMERHQPKMVGITIPFPGNLYSALKCGAYIRQHYPHVTVVMGGGFASTELRTLSDPRLFDYTHYLLLDDGERPLTQLIAHTAGHCGTEQLMRTFALQDGQVVYHNTTTLKDFAPSECGTPSYRGLPLDRYLSVIEMANPMQSLWSNGRWNKLMLAHGCYWGKCAFCDGSLDYIKRYSPNSAVELVDRMERMIAESGERGFHFIDEAAPPSLLKELALEILRRKLTVLWWTNVRFEKSYTADLCQLLKLSGCIAVSGGLEVASDRLLKLINKGVSIAQVSRVTHHFTEAGIMVHAYLMYGFPTQTAQETIDSLEVVRQLFEEGLVQSAFWHRFAMTAHSPVGLHPERYNARVTEDPFQGFAHNDVAFEQEVGDDPQPFGEGLRRSLYNYMRGVGFELPLHKWFDTPVPRTLIPPRYISRFVADEEGIDATRKQLLWLGPHPTVRPYTRKRKGKSSNMLEFTFELKQGRMQFSTDQPMGEWLQAWIPRLGVDPPPVLYPEWEADFCHISSQKIGSTPFWQAMCESGMLILV